MNNLKQKIADLEGLLANLDFGKLQTQLPFSFMDVRLEEQTSTTVQIRNGDLVQALETPSRGGFIRVFHSGQWFFRATTALHRLHEDIVEFLTEIQGLDPSIYAGQAKYQGLNDTTSRQLDFTDVNFPQISLQTKTDLLLHYQEVVRTIPQIKESVLAYTDVHRVKTYRSSSNTYFTYDFNQGGIYISGTLKGENDIFSDRYSKYASQFKELQGLENEILDFFKESQRFLGAKLIPPGKYRIVMSPEMVGVFTHESFGHKSEADFMMGDPESIKAWEIGKKVAVDDLSIVDDGTHGLSAGRCPIDDEGTPARKNYLIKNGRLAGRLHSRLTAQAFDEQPTGNARAISFEFEPIVRMTSTYIEPGTHSFADLVRQADEGLYVQTLKHGSGGSTFTIAPIRAYRISAGKIAEPVKVSVLSGTVFSTLHQIEAIGNDFELVSHAFGGCGKMEQSPLSVADGGPSLLLSEMQVS